MDATYNSQTIALARVNEYKWSVLDILILLTLGMYVFASITPQQVGNCTQHVSVSYIDTQTQTL